MTPDAFIAFISAYVELNPGVPPTPAQWAVINAKLDSCFNKVTPDRVVGAPTSITSDPLVISGGSAADREAGYQAALKARDAKPGIFYKDPATYIDELSGTGDMTKVVGRFISHTC